MKVVICGSRTFVSYNRIQRRISELPKDTLVITGGAAGADILAETAAREQGLGIKVFPAKWMTYGKSAGFKRNIQMLDERPDLVIAFHRNNSRGTAHTIRNAEKMGIPVEIIKW